ARPRLGQGRHRERPRRGHRELRPLLPRSGDRRVGDDLGQHAAGRAVRTLALPGEDHARPEGRRRRQAGQAHDQGGGRHAAAARLRGGQVTMASLRELAKVRKRRRQRRGVALIMVLGAITVLTVFLTELQEETSAELSAALAERDQLRAEYYARSAVNLSR